MALIDFQAFSDVLKMNFRAQIALPQIDSKSPFPVLWLMHGAGDDCTGWFRHTSIERLATRRGLAVVAPDAQLSMYEDMAYGQKFYSHIVDELPEMLIRMLPLSPLRKDNFIAGLSMGGMGALKIALRRPERYAAVACLSAGYTNHRFHEPVPGTPRFNRYMLAFGDAGPESVEEETRSRAKEIALSANSGTPIPRIYHTCGDKDSLRRNADITREFFESFPGNPFAYEYHEYPGRHNWDFWADRVPEMLDFLLLEKKL